MKKKLFILCIVPLLLSACDAMNKNSSSSYQADLKYGEALSDSMKSEILTKAAQNATNLVYAEKTSEMSYDTIIESGTQTVVETYDMYENNLQVKTKTTGHMISNDVEYDIATTETTRNIWRRNIAGFIRYISYEENNDTNVISNISVYSSSSNPVSNTLFQSLFEVPSSNYLAFNVTGGYELVYSNHQRTVTYVEVGGQTKENIVENKTQQIIHFDLSYKFTWSTYVSVSVMSADPVTGEWYSSPKEVSKGYRRLEGRYGQLQTRDVDELYEDISGIEIVWAIEPIIKTGAFSLPMNDSSFTVDSSVREYSYSHVGVSSVTQKYRLSLDNLSSTTNKKNALLGKVNAFVYLFNGQEEKVETYSNIVYTFSDIYGFYTGSTSTGNNYYYFTNNSSYSITFSLQYNDGQLVVSATNYLY